MSTPHSVSLDHRIQTPENVELSVRLAGPAVRAYAYALDLLIRAGILVLVMMGVGLSGAAQPGIGLFLVIWFGLDWFYGTLFEWRWRGRTPGKSASKLRVIRTDGRPIGLYESFIRNFLRAADLQPFHSYGVGWASAISSPTFQRLGDRAAHTLVVHDHRPDRLPTSAELKGIEPFTAAELTRPLRPGQSVLTAIQHLRERRSRLSDARVNELAHTLAEPLAGQLGYRDPLDRPWLFLLRVLRTFAMDDPDDGTPGDRRPVTRRRRAS